MIKQILNQSNIIAIIIQADFRKPGVHFLTPDNYSQQLAYIEHPAGTVIPAHIHNAVPRNVVFTRECLFIRKGLLRVDFYDEERIYLESTIIGTGDVLFLASGGHGFFIIENSEIIEIKQGPYSGQDDKIRFEGVALNKIILAK